MARAISQQARFRRAHPALQRVQPHMPLHCPAPTLPRLRLPSARPPSPRVAPPSVRSAPGIVYATGLTQRPPCRPPSPLSPRSFPTAPPPFGPHGHHAPHKWRFAHGTRRRVQAGRALRALAVIRLRRRVGCTASKTPGARTRQIGRQFASREVPRAWSGWCGVAAQDGYRGFIRAHSRQRAGVTRLPRHYRTGELYACGHPSPPSEQV